MRVLFSSWTQKGTKNALETGRTFATLFADTDLRVRLLGARTENDFKRLLWEQMKDLADEQQCSSGSRGRKLSDDSTDEKPDESTPTPVYTAKNGRICPRTFRGEFSVF